MAKITIKSTRPPGTAVAVFRMAQAAAMHEMLRHWQQTYVQLHFQLAANRRYGYQPRRGDNEPPRLPRQDGKPGTRANPHYSWVKRRTKHHNRPLVFSGDSEHIATSPASFRTTQMSANRVRGEFIGMPRYWYQYVKSGFIKRRHWYGGLQFVDVGRQPNKADELTRIIPEEVADLARVGQARIVEFCQHYQAPTTVVA